MNKLFGIVILFAAAWLMYRLQAGSGSCCGGGYDSSSGSDRNRGQDCCGDGTAAGQGEKKDQIEDSIYGFKPDELISSFQCSILNPEFVFSLLSPISW